MRSFHAARCTAVWLSACVLLAAPPAGFAEEKAAVTGALVVETTAATRPVQATVEVRVASEDAAGPLAQGAPLRTARTGEDGRTRFDGLAPGSYEVRAAVGTTAATVGGVTVPPCGGVLALRLPCGTGPHTLEGRAIWRDGTPFRGWLRLERDESFCGTFAGTRGQMLARADEDGRFRFAGLPAEPYELAAQAEADTCVTQRERMVRLPLRGPVVFVVDEGGSRVHGRVVNALDDTPVAGAKLDVRSLGWRGPAQARADDKGTYALRVPKVFAPEMLVEADGFAPQWVPLAPADQEVDVRLERPGTVRGQVLVEGTDTPVRGARVHAVWDGLGTDQAIHRTATTDAAGHYELRGLVPGRNTLFVLGGGWATSGSSPWDSRRSEALEVELKAGAAARKDLRAVRAASVRIEVTTADGQPALPAALAIEAEVLRVFEDSRWRLPRTGSYPGKTVDREGWIEFDDLIPGVPYEGTLEALDDFFTVVIPALEPGARHVVREKLPIRERLAEGSGRRCEPAPSGAPRIAGHIRGPEAIDRHLVEVTVKGLGRDGNASDSTVHAPCGDRFAIENLESKDYLVQARVRWKGVTYAARKVARATHTGVELTLQPATKASRIERSARVVDAAGRPVPRAQGWIQGPGETGFDNPRSCEVRAGVLTCEPPPGASRGVWIEIVHAQGAMGRPIEAGGLVLGPLPWAEVPEVIRLPVPHVLNGRVVDPEGRGVPEVLVVALPLRPAAERAQWRFAGGAHARARSAPDGSFSALRLGPGSYQVTADPPDGYAWPDFVGPVAPGAEGVEIRLVRSVTARLRIVDEKNEPLPGASVQVHWYAADGRYCTFPQFKNWSWPWSLSPVGGSKRWTADETGTVVIDGLHPRRRHTVYVSRPPFRSALEQCHIMSSWLPQDETRVVIRRR